jgi:hypothetical protein
MANWCNNSVEVSGDIENVKSLYKVIAEMENRCGKLHEGVIPIIQTQALDSYYFDMHSLSDYYEDSFTFQYSSKWSPNLKNLLWLAETFGVTILCQYEEMGNSVYGKAQITEEYGILTADLSEEDIRSCKYYEENPDKYLNEYTEEEIEDIEENKDWTLMEDYEKLDDLIQEMGFSE